MILYQAICNYFKFIAVNDVYIQHIDGATGSHNRFSRLAKETAVGQNSDLGFPRLEITQLPLGNVVDYQSSQMDNMAVRIRVIDQLTDNYQFAEEVTKLDNCKKACMRAVKYILDQQEADTANCLLCAFDPNVKYELLSSTALDGKAVGCAITFNFKQNVDWEAVSYGTFADTSKRKYTQMVTFDALANTNNYTAAEVPELEDMATWTLKSVLLGGQGDNGFSTWNGTTLNIPGSYDGSEYIVCWFEKFI